MGDPRVVQCVALLSFTGEEGSLRAGMRFATTKTRADWLSQPIKGQRPPLAKILYDTTSTQPQVETKEIKPVEEKVIEKPKRKRGKSKAETKPKRRRGNKPKGNK